ncbi:hypothetical protein WALSEDRAFT_59100 [Wallemia mellicola CBS 633.66]|uniref:Checkpoint protein n=1 Tax=Wallemia mellicola (strain ATCC MYA-4683 / CBS 633.66) TaxID=671144 RepID=I4YJH7_WALMC|nr:hypothetical protein WALSEDRAFT_59100 [Wallemia mellicola CBS 633.66]EIM24119.1 hypothetical protein WALSEDRAFT_59100 [Wallemia mellicola CBS 633.66]|eukprot:XP_006955945.1 hypothetical protein WALSEDRAFT_59100 [Wallemia mellicola CBS 633.66]
MVYVGQSGVDTALKSWLQVSVDTLFTAYRCESSNNNEVHIEVSMEQLYRAIKSAHETDDVLLRLMKKGAIPTLNLSISTLSHYNSRFTIEQDVPCRPQKQIYVDTFDQPAIPERNVTVQLPSIPKLKTVLEKLRILDNYVTIRANWEGKLEFSILNDQVGVRTTFEKLGVQSNEGARGTVVVDSRQLIKVFQVPELSNRAFIGICNNNCMAFYGFLESLSPSSEGKDDYLMFVIPSKAL